MKLRLPRLRNIAVLSALSMITLAVTPAQPAFALNNFEVTWLGMPTNPEADYPCYHGTSVSWVNPEPIQMNNNCDVRVWIYYFFGGVDQYNLCLNPRQVNFIPHRAYNQAYISTNTAACGT
jgi:hypothetical protein